MIMKEEIVAVKTEAKRTTRLRRLLANPKILVAPGAYDGTGARLVQALGFQAIYMSGFETSASILGEPDVGYLTMTQMTARLATLSAIVDLPLIADGDTGYGNPLNVRRAVREYERDIRKCSYFGSSLSSFRAATHSDKCERSIDFRLDNRCAGVRQEDNLREAMRSEHRA